MEILPLEAPPLLIPDNALFGPIWDEHEGNPTTGSPSITVCTDTAHCEGLVSDICTVSEDGRANIDLLG